jgi:hypothetical protein
MIPNGQAVLALAMLDVQVLSHHREPPGVFLGVQGALQVSRDLSHATILKVGVDFFGNGHFEPLRMASNHSLLKKYNGLIGKSKGIFRPIFPLPTKFFPSHPNKRV